MLLLPSHIKKTHEFHDHSTKRAHSVSVCTGFDYIVSPQLDMLLRVSFHRKNKTLRSVFRRLCSSNIATTTSTSGDTAAKGRKKRVEKSLPMIALEPSQGSVSVGSSPEHTLFAIVQESLGDVAGACDVFCGVFHSIHGSVS